jgi:hypothetical protein
LEKYNDLEIAIMSCIIQRPELLKELRLEEKHFLKHRRLWKFLMAFYDKFKTFDFVLMYSVAGNKYQLVEYLKQIAESEPAPSLFNKYQSRLIEVYEENEKEEEIRNKVYKLANELYVNKISFQEFKDKINSIPHQTDSNGA